LPPRNKELNLFGKRLGSSQKKTKETKEIKRQSPPTTLLCSLASFVVNDYFSTIEKGFQDPY
jgi:hypothetical protein